MFYVHVHSVILCVFTVQGESNDSPQFHCTAHRALLCQTHLQLNRSEQTHTQLQLSTSDALSNDLSPPAIGKAPGPFPHTCLITIMFSYLVSSFHTPHLL